MIVKMKKALFLSFKADYVQFLDQLQALGLVHVEINRERLADQECLMERVEKYSAITKVLQEFDKECKEDPLVKEGNAEEGKQACLEYQKLVEKREALLLEQQDVLKQVQAMEVWGNCNMPTLAALKEEGLLIEFFTVPMREYQVEWEEQYNAFVIERYAGRCYFVTVNPLSVEADIEAEPVRISEESLSKLQWRKKNIKHLLEEIQTAIEELSCIRRADVEAYAQLEREHLDLEEVKRACESTVDEQVYVIEGYYPANKELALEEMLQKEELYYELSPVNAEDQVPVKLKNNFFVRLFEPIGNMYDTPRYNEMDMTPFFAPLYMMFFGFCLGDAGYGLVLLLVGLVVWFLKKELRSYMALVQFLGASTIFFGLLSGCFFGIKLTDSDLPFSPLKEFDMFKLALALGCLQITFGMALKVVNISLMRGFAYALSALGWFMLIFGIELVFTLSYFEILTAEMAGYAYWGIGIVSGILILFLNNPRKNPLINFGGGLWDVYSMGTGLLGDLLSYIRLFALGISSGILGFVFNQLALNVAPDTIILREVVLVIILLFGHGITLFMSGLGSFVHPIRLTFVEFYKNAGFEGGGKVYRPLSKSNK